MPPRRRQEQRQPTPAARPRRSTKPSRKVPAKVAPKPSESALTPPPDADPAALDPGVRAELRALPAGLAERVASHLAATAMLIDEDPEQAYQHATAARGLAARIAAVREAAGLAAYRTGRYGEALADLRAVHRLTGSPDYLPVMADCERGLGRPDRALALVRSADARRLAPAMAAELAIVAAGARRDLGELDAAILTLQRAGLDRDQVEPWTVRLWYAYADTLAAAGRLDDALAWFRAAALIDEDDETDAAERARDIEKAR